MVGLEMLIRIYPEKRTEFLQAFEMLTILDHLGDRRIDLNLFEQVKEPNVFLWLEHWDNDESLGRYYQEHKFKALMGAVEILGSLIYKRSFLIEEKSTC